MTNRRRAWRNVMVAAINAGLDMRLFGLDPNNTPEPESFRFAIAGIPGIAYVSDAGWSELAINAALWPTSNARRWIAYNNAGSQAGECFAHGRLERAKGAWLQTSWGRTPINCRVNRLASVAAISVEPQGYADGGRLTM
jgi:hypothetical protein